MPDPLRDLSVRGRVVRVDDAGLVCLNDIWDAAGFKVNQKPGDWTRLTSTLKLIEALLVRITGKSRNWTKNDYRSVLYTKRGAAGGSYADVRLALGYAEYLNPKLALEVKEVFLRYKAADATLADDILERATPEANEWAGVRALGRATRGRYTSTLKDHGVSAPVDFAICTNETYIALFDGTAKELKRQRGLKKSESLRDAMDVGDLSFVMAAEALASERIDDTDSRGVGQCKSATRTSAKYIREAINRDRADRHRQGRIL